MKRMSKERISQLGWAASLMSVLMYVSFIAQIIANLNGAKGSWVQPAVAVVNCTLWSCYAYFSVPRDKPLLYANIPGIFLALATVLTSF